MKRWGECPHEPVRSPKFQDSSFKAGGRFKLESENFELRTGSSLAPPNLLSVR
jgi:hypothetical protein